VVEHGPDFEETGDDGVPGPLLPPDDRLWRHPSEIGGDATSPGEDDTRAARERWLTSTPSRAGAWSAGLVGAVLATGVVLMGSHITTWLATPKRASTAPKAVAGFANVRQPVGNVPAVPTGIKSLVAASMAVVRVTTSSGEEAVGDGIVVSSSGMILVPASLVAGALAIEVETPDREVFPGRLVGTDPESGVAVVAIDPDGLELQTVRFSPSYSLASGAWTAIEWAQPSSSTLFVGAVRSVTPVPAAPGMPSLEDAVDTDATPLKGRLDGAVIVNGTGALVGFVSGRQGQRLVELPAPLAEQVASELIHHGHVLHGSLGIVGVSTGLSATRSVDPPAGRGVTTLTSLPVPAAGTGGDGVKLVAVTPKSAGWTAGLRRGDVIEAVDGRAVRSMSDLQQALYAIEPDTPVHLTVARGTRTLTFATRLRAA
jgi:S1-C subfamily serine protease